MYTRGIADHECSDNYGQYYYTEAPDYEIIKHPAVQREIQRIVNEKLAAKNVKIKRQARKIRRLQERLGEARPDMNMP